MFCKTNRNQVSAENLGKLTKFFKEQWAPLISRQEGFKGAYVTTKPNGEFMVMMLWENEAQINAWNDNPEHKQLSTQLTPMFTGSAVVDIYEVQDTIVI